MLIRWRSTRICPSRRSRWQRSPAFSRHTTASGAGGRCTISPTNVKLTTQQAADLLGVSRPTVVRLIEAGEVASERIGNRRKILLTDLLAYREDRRKRQYDAILNTAADLSDEEDPIAVQRRLKQIRKQRAGRRRKSEGV